MKKKQKVIALIPARGGLQEIKNKNMVSIKRRPLIFYTIHEAKKCKQVDEIYVSSENKRILSYSRSLKIKTLKRPIKYSKKNSHPKYTVLHLINFLLEKNFDKNDLIVYLQPTSPLRKSQDISNVIKLMKTYKLFRCLSVTKNQKTIFKSFFLKDKILKTVFDKSYINKRRQDLRETYFINGAIFAFSIKEFLKVMNFPSQKSLAYIMSENKSIDLDTTEDLKKLKKMKI